jgi:hypothetical protein
MSAMTYDPPRHLTQHWHVTKPSATGKRGVVVSQARDAALAGVAVLEAGGNAVDAAVATAFALASMEPWNSGLGGIGFGMVQMAGEAKARMVDFGPVSPRHLSPANFKLTGKMTTELFRWSSMVRCRSRCPARWPVTRSCTAPGAGCRSPRCWRRRWRWPGAACRWTGFRR